MNYIAIKKTFILLKTLLSQIIISSKQMYAKWKRVYGEYKMYDEGAM